MYHTKDQIHSLEQAFLYQLSCQLATVTNLAMKKSRGKYEYKRQIEIAQNGVNWVKKFGLYQGTDINEPSDRVYEVLALPTQLVKDWAKQFEPKE